MLGGARNAMKYPTKTKLKALAVVGLQERHNRGELKASRYTMAFASLNVLSMSCGLAEARVACGVE